ncbi:N-acetylmuramoyl-L-alanine amidase [Roseovarius nanhaiticus]|uniref:N-acetylmuramoyl-L-alanine amidase n=1 Tax=Roseovarius nanhaiticus TaxID=573024 RepID=A0A1N7HFN6_9RHOB|nr:N-acetylmuramoyl-L-alanine amidase [Roseovarius nanhaiticus]SEK97540.1 N-acetylmuramoyl-L-alanine amidase [Roseovarius nanhaiticus]SIS23685.1 N-acetylmuramoyl-L-alanine amidase [Roseovarius nanhaiticus]
MGDAATQADATWHPSPNSGPRRDGLRPELLLIHFTKMQSAEAAVARLCDPAAEVSAHYVIAEDGRLWQLVDEAARAWHAGRGSWRGAGDVNSRSIGIELANTGAHPFPEPQMCVLERLMHGIMARWHIPPEGVLGHSDIAPDRKDDPGARFDWRRLARQGFAVWPEAGAQAPTEAFRDLAAQVGYGMDFSDADLLTALRLRWRPWARGPLVAADMAVLADIAARFGVDRSGADA